MSHDHAPDRCDVAVIGGGVGGLTTAALLAKHGLAVTVLERNPAVGGCLAPVHRHGFTFDSSIHWLNQASPGGLVARALKLVGPEAPAASTPSCFRRYKSQAGDFALTARPDDLLARLAADFPGNREGLRHFFAAARRVGDCFATGWGHPFAAQADRSWADLAVTHLQALRQWWPLLQHVHFSTEDGFRQHFGGGAGLDQVFLAEQRLVACLTPVGWAYQGDFQTPPPGGAAAYPRFLAGAVAAHGGKTLTSCQVDGVILEHGRAAGVRFVQGGIRHELRSRAVVAACDIETVYTRMLPPGSLRAGFLRRLAHSELHASAFQLYLGLDRPAAEFGIGTEHVLLADATCPRGLQNDGDPDHACLCLVSPSANDASMAPPGKGSLVVHMAASHARWADVHGEAYRRLKEDVALRLIARLDRAFAPGLRDAALFHEAATPLTIERLTGNKNGATMGARPSARNVMNRVASYSTPVERLFVSGHWAEYGGGVPVAVKAGVNCAALTLKSLEPELWARFRDELEDC